MTQITYIVQIYSFTQEGWEDCQDACYETEAQARIHFDFECMKYPKTRFRIIKETATIELVTFSGNCSIEEATRGSDDPTEISRSNDDHNRIFP